MDLAKLQATIMNTVAEVAFKVLAAFVFWIVGRWLIGTVVRMLQSALAKQKVDPTLLRYAGSIVTVTLNIILVVGILGYFGVQTTTFAALFAAAILEFNLVGPVLAVRPYCHTDHYWQVYFDANKVLKNDLAEFPAPMPAQNVNVRQVA